MNVAGLLARSNSGEGVKSGPLGLAMILLLCVAVYFLFKSMSKHLKKVRDDFPKDPPPATPTTMPAVEARTTDEPSTSAPGSGGAPPPSSPGPS